MATVYPNKRAAFSKTKGAITGPSCAKGALSWNANGLSLYALPGTSGGIRRAKVGKAVRRLGANKLVCLQETGALAYEDAAFDSQLPEHRVFYGNYKKDIAGVIVAVPFSMLKTHVAKRIRLPPDVCGHILAIGVSSKKTGKIDLVICSVYLPSRGDKTPCLEALLRLPPGPSTSSPGTRTFP